MPASLSPSISPSISPSLSPEDYGIRISKTGQDISDAEKFLIMTSKYSTLKLKDSGQGTIEFTAGDGSATVEITHGLGYTPIFFVQGEYFDTTTEAVIEKYSLWNRWLYQGLQVADYYYAYADTNKLYIVFEASTITDAYSFNLDYMYHIFYDEDDL